MAHEPKPPSVDDETRARIMAKRQPPTPEERMADAEKRREAAQRQHWRGLYKGNDADFAKWWDTEGRAHAEGQRAQRAADVQAAQFRQIARDF